MEWIRRMKIDEAIRAIEEDLAVIDVAGYAVGDYDGPLDMSRAPNGEAYVCLTSGGLKRRGVRVPIWFNEEREAITWWLAEARQLRRDKNATHLYWRSKPVMVSASFVNIAQSVAIQDENLRDSLSVDLHYVSSWLLLSAKDPSGKEIPA
jgi:hypothetical protein